MPIRTLFGRSASRRVRLEVDAALQSDVGCVRTCNEDAGVVVNRSGGRLLRGDGLLVVVADGMGGHAAGDVASREATDWIPRIYFARPRCGHRALARAFARANRAIRRRAQADPACGDMGTTAVALALREGRAFAAHVGDSRLYRVRERRIEPLTRDHSLVQDLVEQGVLEPSQAARHPDSNVVLRALGTGRRVRVSTLRSPLRLAPDDRFVLSSDGLHDLVEEEEILKAVVDADAGEGCRALVALARARGAPDNVTVAVVHTRAPAPERAAVATTRITRMTRGGSR